GRRVDLLEQGGEERALLFDRPGAGSNGNFHQPGVHLGDGRRGARPLLRELGRHQPEVAEPPEEFRDLLPGRPERLGYRRDHQFLTEADLDRLKEGNGPPLGQVGQRLNLVRRALRVELSQRLYQLVPATGRLQAVEVAAQLGKRHSCSSRRSMNARWAGISLRRAVSRSNHAARSTSGNVCIFADRGGHSSSNVLLVVRVTSRSPSTAQAWTILPPACRTVPSGVLGPPGG